MDLLKRVEILEISVISDSSDAGFIGWPRSKAAVVDDQLFEVCQDGKGKFSTPGISPQLVGRAGLVFYINGWFFCFQKKFSDTTDAEAVIRRFRGSGNLDRILMDDVFILFRISCLIGHVPAQGFKERVDEFYSKLGFIVGRVSIGFDILLETLNKEGYLFQGFFHHSPSNHLSQISHTGERSAMHPSLPPHLWSPALLRSPPP